MVLNKKNRRAQSALVGLMIMVFLFFATIILIEPLKEGIDYGRQQLDCNNPSISTGRKATCIIVDAYLPYFVAVVLAAGASYLFFKQISG